MLQAEETAIDRLELRILLSLFLLLAQLMEYFLFLFANVKSKVC